MFGHQFSFNSFFFQTGWVIQNGPLIIHAIVRFYLSLERHNLFCYNAVFFKWKFLQLYIVGSWIIKHYMNTFICIIMYWYSEVKFFLRRIRKIFYYSKNWRVSISYWLNKKNYERWRTREKLKLLNWCHLHAVFERLVDAFLTIIIIRSNFTKIRHILSIYYLSILNLKKALKKRNLFTLQ